jgi:hypothetical protein
MNTNLITPINEDIETGVFSRENSVASSDIVDTPISKPCIDPTVQKIIIVLSFIVLIILVINISVFVRP